MEVEKQPSSCVEPVHLEKQMHGCALLENGLNPKPQTLNLKTLTFLPAPWNICRTSKGSLEEAPESKILNVQRRRNPAAQLDAVVSPGVADALDDCLQRLQCMQTLKPKP